MSRCAVALSFCVLLAPVPGGRGTPRVALPQRRRPGDAAHDDAALRKMEEAEVDGMRAFLAPAAPFRPGNRGRDLLDQIHQRHAACIVLDGRERVCKPE